MINISTKARSVFPDLRVQVLVIENYANAVKQIEMAPLVSRVSNALKDQSNAYQSWRPFYQTMGLKPSKFHSSLEALTRRGSRDEYAWLTDISTVDYYNAHCLIYGATMGCYDRQRLKASKIDVRPIDRGRDTFNPIGAPIDMTKGNDNLLVYAQGNEIMCWALNHRDSKLFSIDETSQSVVLLSESTTDDQYNRTEKAFDAIASALSLAGSQVEKTTSSPPQNAMEQLV